MEKSLKNDTDYHSLLKFLKDIRNSNETWIHRKEISMWSAAVLYLGIVLTITKLVHEYECQIIMPTWVKLTSPIIICFLFLLFIKNEFSALASAISAQQAVTIWIFKILDRKHPINELDFTISENKMIPNFLEAAIKDRRKIIQQYIWIEKPIVPFRALFNGFFYGDKKIHNFGRFFSNSWQNELNIVHYPRIINREE